MPTPPDDIDTDEEEFFISSDDSMTRDILAGANNAEDFGFNPIDEAMFRGMNRQEDFNLDDLDEEQLGAAAFEDLAQRNLNLGGLDAALGLGPVPPAAEEERTRTYPERYQEFVANNEARILAYLRSLPDPSAHMAKEA